MSAPHPADHSPLGKSSDYPERYSPGLLFPIPRAPKWAELGLQPGRLPYRGVDVWNCYELSWLAPSGKPEVAIGEFVIPADSPAIIESKSFKLYLNSLNQTAFASREALAEVLAADLSHAAGAPVAVRVRWHEEVEAEGIARLPGECIDGLDVMVDRYDRPDPALLRCADGPRVERCLHSRLLKSNCPVTGQPDWGSLVVDYAGPELEPASLLRYVASFRQHADFHEQCVERIFLDLSALLRPERLTVYARYVRRGGLDINPYRTTGGPLPANGRLVNQ